MLYPGTMAKDPTAGLDLEANLAKTKARIADRQAKQRKDNRARRRLARSQGSIPRKPKAQNPLDLVKTAVGMGKKHPFGK